MKGKHTKSIPPALLQWFSKSVSHQRSLECLLRNSNLWSTESESPGCGDPTAIDADSVEEYLGG